MFNIILKLKVSLLIFILLMTSCNKNELYISQNHAGLNGSFEFVTNGLPVNWAMFPKPTNNEVFSVLLDSNSQVDGTNCLRLVAHQIIGTTGVRSRRVSVVSGEKYRISFWAKNISGSFQVNRVIRDTSGKKNIRAHIFARSNIPSDTWRLFDEEVLIADNEKYLHLIFRMLEPGELLIDNMKIEKISSE